MKRRRGYHRRHPSTGLYYSIHFAQRFPSTRYMSQACLKLIHTSTSLYQHIRLTQKVDSAYGKAIKRQVKKQKNKKGKGTVVPQTGYLKTVVVLKRFRIKKVPKRR